MSRMLVAYLVALLSFLFLLPGSLAEHGAKLKHKHHHRHHEVAALEPRVVPADFDALQWDDDTRHSFHNQNHDHVGTPIVTEHTVTRALHTTYVVVWKTVWVHPHPVHSKTHTHTHAHTTTLMTSASQLQFSLDPTGSVEGSSTTVTTIPFVAPANSSVIANSSSIANSSAVNFHTTSTITSIIISTVSSVLGASHSHPVAESSAASSTVSFSFALDRTTLAPAAESSISFSFVQSSSTPVASSTPVVEPQPSSSVATSDVLIIASVPKASNFPSTKKHSVTVQSSFVSSLSHAPTSSIAASSSTPSHTNTRTSWPSAALVPTATYSLIHGAARNSPPSQYIKCAAQTASLPKLPANVLSSLNNPGFQSDSPLFNGSGTLTLDEVYAEQLAELSTVPFMNRDGGHGGVIGGHKIFYFADTATFTTPTENEEGDWTGFVSNSIAFDVGNNAFDGKPLTLVDPVGAFINNMGTQRNFVPFTEDEAAWSSGNGWAKRYAIWPWGSLVALTSETSLLYAPIVIQDNYASPQFRGGGVTLVTISMTADGQPVVERPVPGLFGASETQYGVYGGVRSWGPSGVGGSDGKVYLMGTHDNGLLLARTDASSVNDHSSYEYWNNETTPATWTSTPSTTSYFMHGAYSSGDLFYSPMHGTFLSVGQNPYTDSKFYYQYLMSPTFIRPADAYETYEDIVENICKYPWSDAILLFETPILAEGHYTYDGGVHQGYFDDMDIVNGGDRMLLAWTAPTGQPAGSLAAGYQIWTAEVRWG